MTDEPLASPLSPARVHARERDVEHSPTSRDARIYVQPRRGQVGAGPGSGTGTEGGEGRGTIGPNKWTVLAILAVGVFMATLDTSIVNISLPAIAASFGTGLGGAVEWVVIVYLVVSAATLLTIGRVADLVGRKPMWVAGLAVFTLGSALSGLAPSLPLLVAARALQGLGASLAVAVSPAMLTEAFPARERGRALGVNALVVALGTSAGPALGGVITEHLTWRWIFFVNLPLGLLGLVLSRSMLSERRPTPDTRAQQATGQLPRRFDPYGAALLGVGLAALTLGLSFGQEWGWTSLALRGTVALAVAALAALLVVEGRVTSPIVNLALFKNHVFASASLSQVLSFLALFAVSFMLPFYFEQLRGDSAQQAGLLLTPFPLAIAVVAPISGVLADRVGTRWLAAGGLSIACLGLVLLAGLDAHSSALDITWRLVVAGAGQALFQTPNNSAMLGAAPAAQLGTASGVLSTGRVVGQSVSVALAGAVFASLGGAAAGRSLSTAGRALSHAHRDVLQQTFTAGFHGALIVCAALAALGIAASLVRGNESRR